MNKITAEHWVRRKNVAILVQLVTASFIGSSVVVWRFSRCCPPFSSPWEFSISRLNVCTYVNKQTNKQTKSNFLIISPSQSHALTREGERERAKKCTIEWGNINVLPWCLIGQSFMQTRRQSNNNGYNESRKNTNKAPADWWISSDAKAP